MKIYNNSSVLIWEGNKRTIRKEVENAATNNINLSNANLEGANLRGINLTSVNLSHANLSWANLNCVNITSSNLSSAMFCKTDCENASFKESNLCGASFIKTNLQATNLSFTDLTNVKFHKNNLCGANFTSAKGLNAYQITPLLFLLDQPGKIRAYKLVNKNNTGPFFSEIHYEIGETYKVDNADIDNLKQCAPGINLATLDWCIENYVKGYKILIAEFAAKDIAAIPAGSTGKFRVHKCKIVGEKDLKELGL